MPETALVSTRTREKQKHILDIATEMFLRSGYEAVSLDDILSRVGGSKTTLYSYYGNKEGLFTAMVESRCQEVLKVMGEIDIVNMDPKTGLNAIGCRFLITITTPQVRAFYRMMVAEAERHPELAAKFFASGPDTMRRLVQQNLEHWQRNGMLRSGSAATLAVQFLGLMMGHFSMKSLLGVSAMFSEKQLREWVAGGVDLFLGGAAPKKC
jgi:TetR/AcrR family transcriptional regulator, mexJK operon transcriptional repressor